MKLIRSTYSNGQYILSQVLFESGENVLSNGQTATVCIAQVYSISKKLRNSTATPAFCSNWQMFRGVTLQFLLQILPSTFLRFCFWQGPCFWLDCTYHLCLTRYVHLEKPNKTLDQLINTNPGQIYANRQIFPVNLTSSFKDQSDPSGIHHTNGNVSPCTLRLNAMYYFVIFVSREQKSFYHKKINK